MLLGAVGTSLLGNMLAGKGVYFLVIDMKKMTKYY